MRTIRTLLKTLSLPVAAAASDEKATLSALPPPLEDQDVVDLSHGPIDPQLQSSFFALPLEIRAQIYHECLAFINETFTDCRSPGAPLAASPWAPSRRPLVATLGSLRACKRLYLEACATVPTARLDAAVRVYTAADGAAFCGVAVRGSRARPAVRRLLVRIHTPHPRYERWVGFLAVACAGMRRLDEVHFEWHCAEGAEGPRPDVACVLRLGRDEAESLEMGYQRRLERALLELLQQRPLRRVVFRGPAEPWWLQVYRERASKDGVESRTVAVFERAHMPGSPTFPRYVHR